MQAARTKVDPVGGVLDLGQMAYRKITQQTDDKALQTLRDLLKDTTN